MCIRDRHRGERDSVLSILTLLLLLISGLVYFRRGNFSDAIPELEQSVKIDPNPTPDPVNLYLLGMANQKTSRFDEAATAFAKCAAIAGSLQNTCKNGAEEAKKQGSTQLSAPK